jgi:hypothetical protein
LLFVLTFFTWKDFYCICENLSFYFISDPEPDLLWQKIPDSTFSHNIVRKLFNLSAEALTTADQVDLFHNCLHKLSNLSGEALPTADQIDLASTSFLT